MDTMRPTAIAALAIVTALVACPPARAAEFKLDGETLLLDGEIKQGDAVLFQSMLDNNAGIKRVSINSPGGEMATGLRIGELLRKRGLNTYAEQGVREAASAAAYIFMAGTERVVKGERGIGVHAFYTPQRDLRNMIKQRSGEELLKTLNEFERRTQEGTVAVVEYVTRMIGDTRIVSEAVKTGSEAMVWPDTKKLVEMKVATKHVPRPAEEIPDPDWAYGELVAGLAAWLDPSHANALDERGIAILENLLADPDRGAQLRSDIETTLTRTSPPNRDLATTRVVTPMVDGIVRQVRAAAAKTGE